jgi:hypothetical protein
MTHTLEVFRLKALEKFRIHSFIAKRSENRAWYLGITHANTSVRVHGPLHSLGPCEVA